MLPLVNVPYTFKINHSPKVISDEVMIANAPII